MKERPQHREQSSTTDTTVTVFSRHRYNNQTMCFFPLVDRRLRESSDLPLSCQKHVTATTREQGTRGPESRSQHQVWKYQTAPKRRGNKDPKAYQFSAAPRPVPDNTTESQLHRVSQSVCEGERVPQSVRAHARVPSSLLLLHRIRFQPAIRSFADMSVLLRLHWLARCVTFPYVAAPMTGICLTSECCSWTLSACCDSS